MRDFVAVALFPAFASCLARVCVGKVASDTFRICHRSPRFILINAPDYCRFMGIHCEEQLFEHMYFILFFSHFPISLCCCLSFLIPHPQPPTPCASCWATLIQTKNTPKIYLKSPVPAFRVRHFNCLYAFVRLSVSRSWSMSYICFQLVFT